MLSAAIVLTSWERWPKVLKIKENQCPRQNFKLEEEEEEDKEEEKGEEEEEEEEICKHGCTFIIYMVKKTRKPNLKQILWKMTKLVLKLMEEEEEEEEEKEEEEEDEEICKH